MNIGFEMQQQPDSIYINESGLYSLLISSKTVKSKKFVKWLTNDVLPNLRKNNIYESSSMKILLEDVDSYFVWLYNYPEVSRIIMQINKKIKLEFDKL